jgi:alpha-tubulin suppressor-like RCC1 family protein
VSLTRVAGIFAGDAHACAVGPIAGISCWGWNFDGQLGDGSATSRGIPAVVVQSGR